MLRVLFEKLSILTIVLFSINRIDATNPPNILLDSTYLETSVVTEGLLMPWDIHWGDDNWIWMTEQKNKVSKIHPVTKEVVNIKIKQESFFSDTHLGVMGLSMYLDTEKNIFVYLTYLYHDQDEKDKGYFNCTRFKYDSIKHELIEPLLIIDSIGTPKSYLPGGRMLIGSDQKLYICTSDEHAADSLSQKLSSFSGKILRFNLDGSIPSDNPNPNSPIYSLGYRNPQGIAETKNGNIITFCHGPDNDDELNLLKASANYGWPVINGACDTPEEKAFCDKKTYTPPIKAWTPTIAPGSMAYYSHPSIPEWQNSLLLLTLKEGDLRHLPIPDNIQTLNDTKENIHLDEVFGRLRDICVAPNGNLYLLTCNTIPDNHRFARPATKEKLIYDAIIEIKKSHVQPTTKEPTNWISYLMIGISSLLFLFLIYWFQAKKK